jgi:stage IV sporulation protein FA
VHTVNDPKRSVKLPESEPVQSWHEWRKPPTKAQLYIKLAICAAIYMVLWATFHSSHSAAVSAQYQVRRWLTVSYDFTKASDWYASHIGGWQTFLPAFIHDEKTTRNLTYSNPVPGVIMRPYSPDAKGVWISTQPDQGVAVIGAGLVTDVQEMKETGLTITVRHANGVESIYGWLGQANVKSKDWLSTGDEVGIVKLDAESGAGKLYLAIRHNQMYIDPGDVIPLD